MRTANGCLGTLLVGFMTMLVAHFEVTARGQAIGFQPTVAPFPSGSILVVTPAVSADRRYVRMSLDASFSELNGFTNYSAPAAVSGGGANMNGPIGGMGGAGGLGALGGAGGLRSVGLGGPAVAAEAPGLVFGPPAGEPFEQALQNPSAARLPAASSLSQEEKPRAQARNTQANRARSHRGISGNQRRISTSTRSRPSDLAR